MNLVNPQLDAYIEQMEACLAEMPAERRREILEETHGHLEAMVAARRADGLDQEAALKSALLAFGDPQSIGKELMKEWNRNPRYESEGRPMTLREKAMKVLPVVAGALAVYTILTLIIPWASSHNLTGIMFLVLAPVSTAFQIWRYRRNNTVLSPLVIFSLILSFALITILALKIQFATQLQGTAFGTKFDTWFSPVMIGLCIIAGMWTKRDAKKVLPWRQFPHYAKNPIAAEEEYRMSSTTGLITGTTMGCLSTLWMGWQFFGFIWAGSVCLGLILFSVVYGSWLNRTSI